MADFLNNWQTHMSKAGLRLDEEIYEPAVEDCTKALAVAENDEQRAESYYQRGYGYIGSTEFAILQGDMDKVNDLKNKATADWKKAADLGHNDAVRTLKELLKINYTPQKPSSSGGSSSSYSGSSSNYSSPSYSTSAGSAEKGNVFAAILFGIASCFGIFFTAMLVSTWLTGDWSIVIAFLALIGGFIATFISWRNKKMPLFFIMLALSLVGYFNLFGIIPDPASGAKTEQSASATITSGCNFRSGPSTNDAVIRQLQQGDKVTLTGEVQGTWTQISHNGDTGWVSSEFLNK